MMILTTEGCHPQHMRQRRPELSWLGHHNQMQGSPSARSARLSKAMMLSFTPEPERRPRDRSSKTIGIVPDYFGCC